MTSIINILEAPPSFEEMSLLIRTLPVQSQAAEVLGDTTSTEVRKFLAAWLISRFPESISNTPDESLKAAADAVVLCCKQNIGIRPVFNVFKTRLETWKTQDKEKLEENLISTYKYLCEQQIINPTGTEILERTKSVLIKHARRLGGENLLEKLYAHK